MKTHIPAPKLPPKPSKDVAAKLFPGFVQTEVRTSEATIPVFHKGDGPPVLLLHGYPESHVYLAQSCAEDSPSSSRSTCLICGGYGDSSRPADGGSPHQLLVPPQWRWDQIETMHHFGHEQFPCGVPTIGVLASPHRLVPRLSQSSVKKRFCLMDIAPTLTMYRQTSQEFATKYMWWFLPYTSGAPAQNILLGSILCTIWEVILGGLKQDAGSPSRLKAVERISSLLLLHVDDSCPTCEDMRASADIDLEMDEADGPCGQQDRGTGFTPLWGAKKQRRASCGDVLATWRTKASSTVTGHSLDCGHFLQEERPEEVLEELAALFSWSRAEQRDTT